MVDRLSRLDVVAMGLSFLCLIHCLATPFVLIAWPFFGFQQHDLFHLIMAILLLSLALVAFLRGYRHHKNLRVVILGAMGVGFLFLGLFVGEAPLTSVLTMEAAITIVGSLLLIFAHTLNLKGHRAHGSTHSSST